MGREKYYATTQSEVLKIFIDEQDKIEWNPDAFTNLCTTAYEQQDTEMIQFCQNATNMEWNLLLNTCNDVVNPRETAKAK